MRIARQEAPRVTVAMMLIVISLLSGCIDDGNDDGQPTDAQPSPWPLGKWWTFDIEGALPAPWMESWWAISDMRAGGHDPRLTVDQTTTFVVSQEYNEQGWRIFDPIILATDEQFELMANYGLPMAARWYLKEGKSQTMNSFRAEESKLIDFPLWEGKEWSTEFMRRHLDITAYERGVAFDMVARLDGQEVMRYTYDPDPNWLTKFEVLDGNEGHVVLRADLVDHGTDFTGQLFEFDKKSGGQVALCYTNGSGSAPVVTFSSPFCSELTFTTASGGRTAFSVTLDYLSEGPGGQAVLLQRPGETAADVWWQDTCPCDVSEQAFFTVDQVGDHEWTNQGMWTGDERRSLFWVQSQCFHVYHLEQGVLGDIDRCGDDGEESDLRAKDLAAVRQLPHPVDKAMG